MTLTRLVSVERSLIRVGLGKMGGGKFETASVGNSFKYIRCKVKQRNGAVAGREMEVKSRAWVCFVLFEDERNNSKFVW